MHPTTRRGFTLVELLVTVGIIALLVGILLPALGKVQERAKATQTRGLMEEFSKACDSFQQEIGRYPGLVPDDILAGDPKFSSTENALLELMGGGVRRADMEQTAYDALRTADGWTEVSFNVSGGTPYLVKINPGKVGEGPIINGKRYPPFFSPKASDLQAVKGAEYGTTNYEIPGLIDAWGNPLVYLRSVRATGPLAGSNKDRAQFVVVNDSDAGFGGLSPYLKSTGLGTLSVNQTQSGAAGGPYSILDQTDALKKKRTFAQFLRHPGFGDPDKPLQSTPKGKFMVLSAGKDGIFFSTQDGPGNKKSPVTDITTASNITQMGGLGSLDNYDDIRVFGGG